MEKRGDVMDGWMDGVLMVMRGSSGGVRNDRSRQAGSKEGGAKEWSMVMVKLGELVRTDWELITRTLISSLSRLRK